MKKMIIVTCIIVGLVLVAGVGLACHSKVSSTQPTDTAAENEIKPAETATPEAEPAKKESVEDLEIPDFDLQKEKEWVSYYEDSELGTTKYFDAAASMIRQKYGVNGKISSFGSIHFANWYLIAFDFVSELDAQKLDGEITHNTAFLVDLSKKEIINPKNYQAILPLTKRVIEVANQKKPGSTKDMLLHGLATLFSTLEFGHASCYDNPGDERHPKATLESTADNQYVLTYYIVTGSQQYPEYERCTVTISDSDISFKSERLEQP